jgi:hypothetical protein
MTGELAAVGSPAGVPGGDFRAIAGKSPRARMPDELSVAESPVGSPNGDFCRMAMVGQVAQH